MPRNRRAQAIETLTVACRRSGEITLHLERALRELHREPDAEALDRMEQHVAFVHEKTSKIKKAVTRAFRYVNQSRESRPGGTL